MEMAITAALAPTANARSSMQNLPIISAVLLLAVLAAQIALYLRRAPVPPTENLEAALANLEKQSERAERSLHDDIARVRDAANTEGRAGRTELGENLKQLNATILQTMAAMADQQRASGVAQNARLDTLMANSAAKMDQLKTAVETKLKELSEKSVQQLEEMRKTVDEKLQGTLEKRLGESFKLVSDRLEAVHKGLGEMQTLAVGVGDLKKMLGNVSTRGAWGELQLSVLLEQVLTPEQYERNVSPKNNGQRVEFAIKLPGRSVDVSVPVWLPIDAKFPVEDYQRLLDAHQRGDAAQIDAAGKALEARVKACAQDICGKYIDPPNTTDFAILFLPVEGLFAEVVRRTGLSEFVQRQCRVVIAGPTTLWSILNSLQMGFRTLAIEKRSSEVWNLLGAVKTEWSRYGEMLDKVKKKLSEASNTIDTAATRTRAIGNKLTAVQQMPATQADALLALPEPDREDEEPAVPQSV